MAPPGNQAANGENKPQPVVSGETGLLDSIAVKKFMENKDRIQLLLFDLIMPKKNGKEAYDEIKKIAADMRVIYASGYAPDIVRQRAMLDKDVPIIYKPVSPTELLKQVRETLDR